MAILKSRVKLHEFLTELQAHPAGPKLHLPSAPEKMSNEVYGRQAMIYLTWKSPEDRRAGEAMLGDAGFRVHRDYSPGSPTSEVQVSYFKGLHWNE